MILRRIELKAWRNILKKISVGPFSEKITIIYGPNGTGKSALFEALRCGIFDSHNVTGSAIESIKPWGRELSPEVTIEFCQGGATYRLKKQFLNKPFVELEREEKGGFVPFKEGRAAEDFVRSLFSDQSPGRGLSKSEHYGLCQVLWAPQGGLKLNDLSDRVVTTVKEALGMQVAGVMGGPIEEGIERRYLTIYTRGGRLKSGKDAPPVVRLAKELEKLKEDHRTFVERYKKFKEASLRLEELRTEREEAEKEVGRVQEELKTAKERFKKYERIKSELDKAKAEEAAARAEYEALDNRIKNIKNKEKDIEEIEREINDLKESIDSAEKLLEHIRKELADWQAKADEVERDKGKLKEIEERLELAQKLHFSKEQIARRQKRLGDIEECREAIEEKKRRLLDLNAPDSSTLDKIEDIAKRRDTARTKLESKMVHLEIVAERDLDIDVIKAEGGSGKHSIKVNEKFGVKGAPYVAVNIPGVARLYVRGPVSDIDKLKSELECANKKLKDLTLPYGTEDIKTLKALLDDAEELKREIKSLEDRLSMLTEDGEPDILRKEEADHHAIVENIIARFKEWKDTLPDIDSLEDEYEKAKYSYEENSRTIQSKLIDARHRLHTAETEHKILIGRLDEKEKNLKRTKADLEKLLSDGKTTEELEKALDKLAFNLKASRAPIENFEAQLKEFDGDPAEDVEFLEQKLKDAERIRQEARDKEKEAEGVLSQLSGEGIYTKLSESEERLESVKQKLASEERYAKAISLLYETVKKERHKLTASVTAPLESVVTAFMQRIAGPRLKQVRFNETLIPSAVQPVDAESTVSIDNLSGGETEQLYFVCRLALADILAKDERQLFVMDDVLTATDTGRFKRVLALLDEMKEKLQIVILTCHPERYSGLQEARFYDLEGIIKEAKE